MYQQWYSGTGIGECIPETVFMEFGDGEFKFKELQRKIKMAKEYKLAAGIPKLVLLLEIRGKGQDRVRGCLLSMKTAF